METKSPFKSKTVWVGLIMASAAFIPSVSTWIAANPTIFAEIVSAAIVGLRMISKGKIEIS